MRLTSSPIDATIPSSSSSSRRRASRGCSPFSIFPPGNSHLSGMVWWRVRWHTRSLPAFTMRAATTRFMTRTRSPFSTLMIGLSLLDYHDLDYQRPGRLLPGAFQFLSYQLRAVLHKILMFGGESCREVAVYVQFTNNLAVSKYRDDDLRLGL